MLVEQKVLISCEKLFPKSSLLQMRMAKPTSNMEKFDVSVENDTYTNQDLGSNLTKKSQESGEASNLQRSERSRMCKLESALLQEDFLPEQLTGRTTAKGKVKIGQRTSQHVGKEDNTSIRIKDVSNRRGSYTRIMQQLSRSPMIKKESESELSR